MAGDRDDVLESNFRDVATMAKITVRYAGEPAFEWDGDADDVQRVKSETEAFAKSQRLSAADFAHNSVLHYRDAARSVSRSGAEVLATGVLYFLLQHDTRNPRRPGVFADYTEQWAFEFDLRVASGTIAFDMLAMPQGVPEPWH
jgi:hypothetical protein